MSKPISYGATIENINLIHDKAKSKKDGVYTFRGVVYRVRKNQMTHYAYDQKVLLPGKWFSVVLGACGFYEADRVRALKSIKDEP